MATYFDRIQETSTTTGTGTITLLGAKTGYQSFSTVGNGNTTFYVIVHQTANEWEVGSGTWNTGNTLSRTTIYVGSNGTSAVDFSAGTKDVFQSCPANHLNTIPIANGGTGQASKTPAFDALSPTTTKGDLIVYDGSDNVRLAKGADKLVLLADSSQSTGLKWSSPLPAGIILPFAGGIGNAPAYTLECDGAAISRTTYSLLYAAIGTTWGSGDGSTTFNIPNLNGRSLIGAGTALNKESVVYSDVSTGNDTLSVSSNVCKWITGMACQLTTTGGLPSPLATSTTYYIIRASSTTIQFATSQANAIAGSKINLTTQGTGTHTITQWNNSSRSLGKDMGWENHLLLTGEMPAHSHDSLGVSTSNNTTGGSANRLNAATQTSTSTGGDDEHNNMQPCAVVTWIIGTGGQ